MSAPTTGAITSTELRKLLESSAAPRVVDVRTPAEFETAHIAGSYNVPLDLLNDHGSEVAKQLDQGHDIVLVCRSGQRATQAAELLQSAGVPGGSVLENGITAREGWGFEINRGVQRWDLERQVRLVAGSIVLSSVLGSVAVPRLKWLAAAIGAGLSYAAISNTCAMGTALSKLPYNRGATTDAETVISRLAKRPSADRRKSVQVERRPPPPAGSTGGQHPGTIGSTMLTKIGDEGLVR
jgi:rhodanese-related sulfurtransferase